MTRLDRLEVTAFRGILHSTLPFDGGSVVLGGANGTGKTAFVDALEFLYTGSIATLAGTAGLALRHHGAHIHADSAEARVTGYFDDPEASATRWLSGPVDCSVDLDEHIVRGSRLAFILRRSQLQGFIHAKPADRYRSLSELIGLERLDEVQSTMRKAFDVLQRTFNAAENELSALDSRIEASAEEIDDGTLVAALNERLDDLGFGEYRLETFDDLGRVRSALVQRVQRPVNDHAGGSRAEFLTALERTSHERLREALATYIELSPSGGEVGDRNEMLQVLGLLSRGRDVLRSTPDAHTCPLCASDINPRVVLSDLVRRIGRLEEVGLLQQRLDRARDDLQAALTDTAGHVRSLQSAANAAGVQSAALDSLTNSVTMVRESLRTGTPAETIDMAGRLEGALERSALWMQETIDRLSTNMTDREPSQDSAATVSEALSLLEEAGVQRATAARLRAERQQMATRRAHLAEAIGRHRRAAALASSVASTFTRVRNEDIQQLFDKLQSDLVRFYETLHPGEGYRALSIAMDPRKRGSADLRLDFYDRDEQDPRAFASEGHLDSLGLCIFLAFVRQFNGDWPLLVLDDVVSSVDASHKARVARLLFEEFGDRQLFITTHDARWFNEIRRLQGELNITDAHNLVIESWSLDEGPVVRPAAS